MRPSTSGSRTPSQRIGSSSSSTSITKRPGCGRGRRFCRVTIPLLGEIAPAESQWARSEVLVPLNEQVAAAAEAHGWTLAENVDESFRTTASAPRRASAGSAGRTSRSCGRRPGALDSALFARVSGTLHPNELGHMATAELIGDELRSALSEPIGAEEDDQGTSGGRRLDRRRRGRWCCDPARVLATPQRMTAPARVHPGAELLRPRLRPTSG